MEKETLIFGHKNPDTDTICSALVKEILEKHNYKYGVTSKEGKGTAFYFEII